MKIFKVFNICHYSTTGKYVFLAKLFKQIEPFYKRPINSLKLGIAVVKNLSDSFIFLDIEQTDFKKYVVFKNMAYVQIAFPILHSLADSIERL